MTLSWHITCELCIDSSRTTNKRLCWMHRTKDPSCYMGRYTQNPKYISSFSYAGFRPQVCEHAHRQPRPSWNFSAVAVSPQVQHLSDSTCNQASKAAETHMVMRPSKGGFHRWGTPRTVLRLSFIFVVSKVLEMILVCIFLQF